MSGIWGNIFAAVLSGVASSAEGKEERRASKEEIREGGMQNRATSAFETDNEYYYNQLLRKEKSRALDTGYNQFSTVRNFAPNYTPATGLDAVPAKPKPGDY